MTLYTIMPNEWVLQNEKELPYTQENFYYKGVLVTAQRVLPYRYQILGIISTNPNDYLNEEFQPGRYINSEFFEQIH
ncbi:YlzJ-like family protein [Bacillus sp. JJ722]|uniref:YlzJ-like family protein n=1 Tax=Bacillus sp. JJ722 TaxID=3122973 RepID=UPI003000E1DD